MEADRQPPDTAPPSDMPLSTVPVGRRVILSRISGRPRQIRRLTELGLTPGVVIEVVRDGGGPLLIAVRDSRIALGRSVADRIVVHRSLP